MQESVEPFVLNVPQSALDDLRARLAHTRWPDGETVDGWGQGVPLERAKSLAAYWRDQYDWRRCEAMLNGFGQFKTEIDGLNIHFLHVRSPHAEAMPLLITHGWPGSVIEFHKIIGPLTDPVAHGGSAADAFHVIAPSLPGYGFSDRPAAQGWKLERIGDAWIQLMQRLGYKNYVAQGGDWGAGVTAAVARRKPDGLLGIHFNLVVAPPKLAGKASPEEQAALDAWHYYYKEEAGYSLQQTTRPQTLGYGLADSPVGQAMWIYEKFKTWTDCDGDPETVLTCDEILDDVMMYWLNNCGASSARLYWESFAAGFGTVPIDLPVGCSLFPKEIFRSPRHWAEAVYPNIIHWNTLERGGHFAAFEQPALFVRELRDCFRQLR